MDFCLPILPPTALALLRFCQRVFVASIALQHSNSVAKKGFKSEQEKVFKKTSPAAPPLRITQLQNALRVRRIGKFFQLRPPLPRAAGLGAARGAPPSAGSPFPRCPRAAWQWGRAASQESPAGKGIFFSGKIKIQRGEATSKGRGRQHFPQVRQGAQKPHVAVFLHLLRRTGGFPSAFRALFPLFFPSLSGYHHARPSKEQMPAASPGGGGGTAEPPASRCPPASGRAGGDGNESGQGRKFHVSTSRNGR